MRNKMLCGLVIFFVAFAVCGCASTQKKTDEEIKTIKSKVDTLETRVEGMETKQAEVERAASEHAQAIEELKTTAVKTNFSPRTSVGKGKEHIKDIQTCLKNAGYYTGAIDGIKGGQTVKATKEFQKANGLAADGVVGKKTWELLSKYSQGSGN